MAEVELPVDGWAYDYTAVEAPRRGQPVLRPVVPVNFSRASNETISVTMNRRLLTVKVTDVESV